MEVITETRSSGDRSPEEGVGSLGEFVLHTLARVENLLAQTVGAGPARAAVKSITFSVAYDPGPETKRLAAPREMNLEEARTYFRANDLRVTFDRSQLLRVPATRIARLEVTIRV